ncbi:tripartite tricarboxylate transporter TctB family protein [Alkalicoccus daliensis]|uniref:Putative tricarboxylic transport membrane protein n=1 Tax=Alkalicoccus daliensis TaxID=745820 RepID=A0A1H0EB49_9BACI|nr:tripartite tricarboxylate transporter TctB family protein [Alkalicoccus daliensis]SDN79559.1 putative tricarboxylic transport membrane protein [Alkalicoccus daliensis]
MNHVSKLKPNQTISIILFLFSCFYLFLAFQIPDYALPRPVDSDLFPKILGSFMMLLSIGLFFEKDAANEKEESEQEKEEKSLPFWARSNTQIVVTAIAIGAYIFLLERAGFVLTTFIFIFGMTRFYGYKHYVSNLIVALFVSIGFYVLLTRGLGVYLPPGLLPA